MTNVAILGRSPLAHRQHVCHLYRRTLKLELDWAVIRSMWYDRAETIRERFRDNIEETNTLRIEKLVLEAEEHLAKYAHPNPYLFIDSAGGSSYQRNTPPPKYTLEHGWAPWGEIQKNGDAEL